MLLLSAVGWFIYLITQRVRSLFFQQAKQRSNLNKTNHNKLNLPEGVTPEPFRLDDSKSYQTPTVWTKILKSLWPARERRRFVKDPIFDCIYITEEEWKLIDQPYFNALRDVHQLGVTCLLYPSAEHSRFPHLLQTCHLAGWLLSMIKEKQPELCITTSWIKCVRAAGLWHDAGHSIASHAADEFILKHMNIASWCKDHETRGVRMFAWIVRHYNLDFTEEEIRIVQAMIVGHELPGYPKYLFGIVNCKRTSLDVDKLSYTLMDLYMVGKPCDLNIQRVFEAARVIDDKIMYASKVAWPIKRLFQQRKFNYKEIYLAPVVKKSEALMVDCCQLLAKVYDWEALFPAHDTDPSLDTADTFRWRLVLNDSSFFSLPAVVNNPCVFQLFPPEKQALLTTAYRLFVRIQQRDWYHDTEDHLVDLRHHPVFSHAYSPAASPTSSQVPNHQQSQVPPLYPAPYVHRVSYVCGLSSNERFDPLQRVLCYLPDYNKTTRSALLSCDNDEQDESLYYHIGTVQQMIETTSGSNDSFERHTMVLTRD